METIEEKKRNQKIDQLVDSQSEFTTNVNKLLRNNLPQNNRDRFLVKKDFTFEEQKSQGKKLNQLLKINAEILNENKKRNNGFKTLLKIGAIGGLLGWLLFGKKDDFLKGIKSTFSNMGGLLDGIFSGNWDKVKSNLNNIGEAFGDGLIGQILTGKNKPFNTLLGSLKMQGGLFQGLIFGDWDLFKKGFEDLKNNLTLGQAGLLGALLFGAPLAKGLLTSIGTAAAQALFANPVVLSGLASALSSVVIIKAGQKLFEAISDQSEAKKNFELLKTNNLNNIETSYREKGYSEEDVLQLKQINETLMDMSNEQYKKSDKEKLRDIEFKNTLREKQDQIIRKYSKIAKPNNVVSSSDSDKLFGVGGTVSNNWDDLIGKYGDQYKNVPKNLVKAIIQQESSGNPNAEGKMTKYGTAKGLGQFIDSTAKQYIPGWTKPEDSYNPEKNIAGIFAYMDDLLKKNNGDIKKATGRYFGTGRDPVLNKTTGEYSKEVMKIYGELNQNKTNSKNIKDLKIKIDKVFSKPLELGEETINKLSKKIAEEGKVNVPVINSKQNVLVNSRG